MGDSPGQATTSQGAGVGLPLVSVVVPVYNGERYLEACLESVLAQTYGNFELIVIDNASTDSTAQIIATASAKDDRVRCISNRQLLPLIQNHNKAVSAISANAIYCKPLMADDWLFPDCIEKMVAAMQRHRRIGLVCALAIDGQHVIGEGCPFPGDYIVGSDVARWHLEDRRCYFFGSPTSTMIRADLVRESDQFYPEDNIAADFEACLQVLRRSDFSFIHQVLLFQRMHEDSETSRTESFESGVAGRFCAFGRYAKYFLDEESYKRALADRQSEYYRAIARRTFGIPGKAFWSYHRQQFRKAGQEFSRLRVVVAMLKQVFIWISSPGDLARRLSWYWSDRRQK